MGEQGTRTVDDSAIRWRDEVTAEDVERIGELVEATGFFHPGEVSVARELVEERCAKGDASGYHFLLAEAPSGALLGYTCYGPIACTESSWDLYWIAVAPSAQRIGLGRRLMEATEQEAAKRGGTRMYADTSGREQYSPTRSFYERCGYATAADLEDFYAPGDSKRIYAKRLT